jgi:hypothetical protein
MVIPKTVEIISRFAFASCRKLIDFASESDFRLKRIEESAFFSCFSLRSLVIPNGVEYVDGSAFCIQGFDSISMSRESPRFSLRNGILYGYETIAFIPSFTDHVTFHIEGSVEVLAKSCFSSCPSLCEMTCNTPKLHRIEGLAFALSALEAIVIPQCVESLGRAVFCCCSFLPTVLFEPESKMVEIGEYAF